MSNDETAFRVTVRLTVDYQIVLQGLAAHLSRPWSCQ